MPQSEKLTPDPLSKTQRKNDMLDLQKLGEKLLTLSATQLAKLTIPDTLLTAINHAHTLKTHESIRRHLQYIGKLMRHVDTEAISHALKQIEFTNEQQTQAFHDIEQWREQLITGGDAMLQQLLQQYPAADRQHIRQLVRQAIQDRKNNKKTGAETALFRYLRELLSA